MQTFYKICLILDFSDSILHICNLRKNRVYITQNSRRLRLIVKPTDYGRCRSSEVRVVHSAVKMRYCFSRKTVCILLQIRNKPIGIGITVFTVF